MKAKFNKSGSMLGLAAVAAMIATPAVASPMPAIGKDASIASAYAWNGDAQKAENHRRWRGWGRHHRDDIDAGDVITGIVILGGIAAIASAASQSDNRSSRRERADREERNREMRDREWRERNGATYGDDDGVYRGASGAGTSFSGNQDSIDGAANLCLRAAGDAARMQGQDGQINSVTSQQSGWRVDGTVGNGPAARSFVCSTQGGRVESIRIGNTAALDDMEDMSGDPTTGAF